MKRRIKRVLAAAGAVLVGLLFLRFVATPYVVVGDSMVPTLRSWDLCVMARPHGYQPKRGEIIVFRTSEFDEQGRHVPPLHFIKRVVGLPGETVAIRRGVVQVNGKPLEERYTEINPTWDMDPVTVPAGKVFVLGDNRTVELEETLHGLVATRLVEARMLWHWRWKK